MRKRKTGNVTVNAISGTHTVFLGIDIKDTERPGLLGFAIRREDHTEQEVTWLKGQKTFPSTGITTAFQNYSSFLHPFQTFQWADYSAKPGYEYTYQVVPVYGTPANLVYRTPTKVNIATEPLHGDDHSVYFNRGAIASQYYTKRFGPVNPESVGPEAFNWLTRDLKPGILHFINRAMDDTYGLYCAIYETKLEEILDALRQAHLRDVDVEIVYDARPGKSTTEHNEEGLLDAQVKGLSIKRTKGTIMHNKFIVLTKDGNPIAVWTGSTNFSKNAFYGQLNVGHVINDATVASNYLEYYKKLKQDKTRAEIRAWGATNNPIPPLNDTEHIEIFSPHSGQGVFNWFKTIAESANRGLLMSFPFGIVKDFRPVFGKDDDVLRFALMEKYVNGGNQASRAIGINEIKALRQKPNVIMALGSRIFLNNIDGWRKEASGIGTWVNWVHTKFMLVDPLTDDPTVITGSANWSMAGTNSNDENMIKIKGNKRVADIYFTEFLRIFSHHAFREAVKNHLDNNNGVMNWQPRDLDESDSWKNNYFIPGSQRTRKRKYFAGE